MSCTDRNGPTRDGVRCVAGGIHDRRPPRPTPTPVDRRPRPSIGAAQMADGTEPADPALGGRGRAVGCRRDRPRPGRARRPLRDGGRRPHGRPASTPGRTTSAATAAPAGGVATWTAGRSSTTTSRRGWRPSGTRTRAGRWSCTATRWAGSSRAGYVLSGRDRPLPDALVLSAPGLDDDQPGWKRTLARLLDGDRAEAEDRQRRPRRAAARATRRSTRRSHADPLCSTLVHGPNSGPRRSPSRTGSGRRSPGSTPCRSRPTSSTARPTRSCRCRRRRVFEGKGNMTRRVHEGLRHECHHEPEHGEVLAEVVAWLRETLPGASSAGRGGARGGRGRRPRCRLRAQPHIRLRGAHVR